MKDKKGITMAKSFYVKDIVSAPYICTVPSGGVHAIKCYPDAKTYHIGGVKIGYSEKEKTLIVLLKYSREQNERAIRTFKELFCPVQAAQEEQKGTEMINKEIQNLLANYKNRAIRTSTDYQIVTIGRLQIENLNWKWEPAWSDQLNTYMMWDPYDWMSPPPYDKFNGNFKVIKYGLSCRKNDLTIGSYTPLWEIGTDKKKQCEIMAKEMHEMEMCGSRKCVKGIEIVPESPLWNTVDTLATRSRNTFRTLLAEKVKDLESRHVQYDAERVLDDGVNVTPEILALVRQLGTQMTK